MSRSHWLHKIAIAALCCGVAACANHRAQPLPRFTPPTHRKGPVSANDILFRALGLVGTPYHYGGTSPEGGFDCSGLVGYVFRDIAGIVLPRTAHDISDIPAPPVDRDSLASGDLVFFTSQARGIGHVGIYVGGGRFVHAPNEGGTVRLDFLSDKYWRDHYAGAKRIPLDE